MKKIIITLSYILLVISLSSCATLTPEEKMAAKTKAIERYLEVVPTKVMMDDMALKLAKTIPEKEQAEFIDFMTKKFNMKLLEAAMKKSMQKRFTLPEIEYLIATSSSPEGKSVMKKMGDYMADIMPVIEAEVIRMLKEKKKESTVD
ncbi:MAG: DUF2059 domain-containing protein [Methylococcales bacterium]|nr:DUF2059 domain-containing protein [Methylococcales bacterium]